MQTVSQWRPPVASIVAQGILHWVMCLVLHWWIAKSSKGPAKEVHLFAIIDFLSCITLAKRPCYGRLKIKPSHSIIRSFVLDLFVSFWMQPATMNAVSATIVTSVQARFQ
jgi:hypothetical protein